MLPDPTTTETSPLLPASASAPLSAPSPPSARVLRLPSPTLPHILLLLVALPALLFLLLHPTTPSLAHPGVDVSGPVHLQVPHVPLSFVALGDWGRKGKHRQPHVAQAMADTVQHTLLTEGYNPHFIISTGDNFYSNGVEDVNDPDFDRSYRDVYNHRTLSNVPWYSVLGNHDHVGSIRAQVQFSTREPRWNMPDTYFAQKFADNLIAIFLDTTPFIQDNYGDNARNKNRQDPHIQVQWLKRQLADSPSSAYFLIIAHHNLYTMSTGGNLASQELRDMLEPVLMPYHDRTLAYISGHEHSLMHMQPYPRVDNDQATAPYTAVVDHFISGAGSKLDDLIFPPENEVEKWQTCCGVLPKSENTSIARTVWGAQLHGFFVFRFDGRVFSAKAVDDNGNVAYEYEKTVA